MKLKPDAQHSLALSAGQEGELLLLPESKWEMGLDELCGAPLISTTKPWQ